MGGRLDGMVAFITGAARGQGRSHAVRLAEEGADIIAIDICHQIESNPYPLATAEDLEGTPKLVSDLGRRIVTRQADVRERSELRGALEEGMAEHWPRRRRRGQWRNPSYADSLCGAHRHLQYRAVSGLQRIPLCDRTADSSGRGIPAQVPRRPILTSYSAR